MGWESFVGGGLTVGTIIFGLSSWLGKVWASHILEKDKVKYKIQIDTLLQDLRTKNSKELFVHKVQFEKEFEVYKDLWGRVLHLARKGKQFRFIQTGNTKPPNEAYSDYALAYKVLSDKVFSNQPFYEPDIFDLCKNLLDAAYSITKSLQKKERLESRPDPSNKTGANIIELEESIDRSLDKINALVSDICTAIRTRIWSTDKTGWDRNNENGKP